MKYTDGIPTASAVGQMQAPTGSVQTPYWFSVDSQANVQFQFEILAPTNTTALVDFTGALSTTTSGAATAFAYATLVGAANDLVDACSQSQTVGYCSDTDVSSFSGSKAFVVPTNTVETFEVGVEGDAIARGNFNVSVDPALTLDAADVSGGTLYVSPVPLPAAAWLLLSGLGGVGALARRRRGC